MKKLRIIDLMMLTALIALTTSACTWSRDSLIAAWLAVPLTMFSISFANHIAIVLRYNRPTKPQEVGGYLLIQIFALTVLGFLLMVWIEIFSSIR